MDTIYVLHRGKQHVERNQSSQASRTEVLEGGGEVTAGAALCPLRFEGTLRPSAAPIILLATVGSLGAALKPFAKASLPTTAIDQPLNQFKVIVR